MGDQEDRPRVAKSPYCNAGTTFEIKVSEKSGDASDTKAMGESGSEMADTSLTAALSVVTAATGGFSGVVCV
jgi:hypothetical protein